MTGPDFENVYYKDNIIQGSTMQSYYMGVGGTNWGWLPAPQVYTSYDYGAAIRETGEIGTPPTPMTSRAPSTARTSSSTTSRPRLPR